MVCNRSYLCQSIGVHDTNKTIGRCYRQLIARWPDGNIKHHIAGSSHYRFQIACLKVNQSNFTVLSGLTATNRNGFLIC